MMSRENLTFAVAMVASVIVLFTVSLSRPYLVVEDGPMEDLSAAGFATAALLACGTALRSGRALTPAERIILFVTGGISVVLFLSEISFGARIFHVQMPKMRGGGEFDGGHDIVILVFRQLRDAGSTGIVVAAVGIGLVLAVAVRLLSLFRQEARAIVQYVLWRAFEFRLIAAVCMISSAVVLDVIPSYKASVLEEIMEFSASGVLILAVFGLLRDKGRVVPVLQNVRTKITVPPHSPRQF